MALSYVDKAWIIEQEKDKDKGILYIILQYTLYTIVLKVVL